MLPLGLLAGLLLPKAAQPLLSFVPELIALLLLVACLRIDLNPAELGGQAVALLLRVCMLQLILPLLLASVLLSLNTPADWLWPVVLVAAAAPISGVPNLVILLGENPTLALRLLIMGTALLPLTVMPVLYVLDPSLSITTVVSSSLRLLAVIAGAISMAWLIRRSPLGSASLLQRQQLDGIASLLLALVVIGLMGAIHKAWDHPAELAQMLLLAIGVNVGLQSVGWYVARVGRLAQPVTLGVINGNRNIALFLTALPATVTEPLMLFIACYQIPMYLTPLLGRLLYRIDATRFD